VPLLVGLERPDLARAKLLQRMTYIRDLQPVVVLSIGRPPSAVAIAALGRKRGMWSPWGGLAHLHVVDLEALKRVAEAQNNRWQMKESWSKPRTRSLVPATLGEERERRS
jgi:hypothetical protein